MKTHRPLWEIANDIANDYRKQGKTIYFGAVPYVKAMLTMDQISGNFGADSGADIVARLLGNLQTWKGEKAREIKKELNAILKS